MNRIIYLGPHIVTSKFSACRFKGAGMKRAKPVLGDKVFTDQGYVTDSDSDVNDVSAKELRAPRKVYSLASREYALLKTYVIISCVYVILWFPHVVLTFVVTFDPLSNKLSDWPFTLVTCLTHCTHFAVTLVYLTCNSSFRRCVRKTLCCWWHYVHLLYSPVTQLECEFLVLNDSVGYSSQKCIKLTSLIF